MTTEAEKIKEERIIWIIFLILALLVGFIVGGIIKDNVHQKQLGDYYKVGYSNGYDKMRDTCISSMLGIIPENDCYYQVNNQSQYRYVCGKFASMWRTK